MQFWFYICAKECVVFSDLRNAANIIAQQYQAYLDASTPFTTYRWAGTGALLFLFFLRIILAEGWYIGMSIVTLHISVDQYQLTK